MAQCPKCQTPLKEDFGLETCSGCGVVVFVNDDKVSVQEDEVSIEPDSSLTFDSIQAVAGGDTEELVDANMTATGLESLFENDVEDLGDMSAALQSPTDPAAEPIATNDQDDEDHLETRGESALDSDFDIDSAFESEHETVDDTDVESASESEQELQDELLVPTSADDFLEEMQLFGEMDSDKFQDAIYFFDIEIASIDSKDIRNEILDILDDSKLNLKIENLNQKIKNGVLLLPSVPAVKAFIIVQRVSHLPCELSWALVEVHDLGAEDKREGDARLMSETESNFGLDPADEFS